MFSCVVTNSSSAALPLSVTLRARKIASLICAGSDTHSDQPGALANGAKEVADCLAAFQHDLELRHLGSRVVTLLWSEFGRRAQQNDSNGTDHGAGGIGFLMGANVRHKMVGEFPGLAHGLDSDGNLKHNVDFRSVYASLLEHWFDVDPDRILPDAKKLPRFNLV